MTPVKEESGLRMILITATVSLLYISLIYNYAIPEISEFKLGQESDSSFNAENCVDSETKNMAEQTTLSDGSSNHVDNNTNAHHSKENNNTSTTTGCPDTTQ